MAERGGKRQGSGRKKGTPNKSTAELKKLAQVYTQDALDALAKILKDDKQPASARVSAANALLDRAFGKPTQAITGGDEDERPLAISVIENIIVDPANKNT